MRRRWFLVIGIYVLLIGGGWIFGEQLSHWSLIEVRPINEPEIHRIVMAVSAIYIVAAALPFVPGAEIGLALIAAFGSRIVVLVYGCMVLALLLAFCIGRFIPVHVLAAIFGFLELRKARDLVLRFAELDPADRITAMAASAHGRWAPYLLKHRYVALAIALNVPGNSLLGGGGGLSMLAGMSGIFSMLPFCITVALAVAPLPLVVLLAGYQP